MRNAKCERCGEWFQTWTRVKWCDACRTPRPGAQATRKRESEDAVWLMRQLGFAVERMGANRVYRVTKGFMPPSVYVGVAPLHHAKVGVLLFMMTWNRGPSFLALPKCRVNGWPATRPWAGDYPCAWGCARCFIASQLNRAIARRERAIVTKRILCQRLAKSLPKYLAAHAEQRAAQVAALPIEEYIGDDEVHA